MKFISGMFLKMNSMNFFRTKYVACQRKNILKWECNCSFESWVEADKYSQYNHTKGVTTLLTINNAWPDLFKKSILSFKLQPSVVLED